VTQFRLAELVAGLSVVSDLGKGLADGQGLRGCVLAHDLAERAGVGREDQEAVFWIGLLRFVGCTATASEMAAALGDELAVSAAFAAADPRDLRDLLRSVVAAVGPRPGRILSFLTRAPGVVRDHEVASCEVAQAVAGRLGLPAGVIRGLGQVFERWDGHGHPGRAAGRQLSPAVRIWQVAHIADLLADQDGPGRAAAGLRRRAGRSLDPELARIAAESIDALLVVRSSAVGVDAVLAVEPEPHRLVSEEEADGVLAVFGLLADLKAPCFRGHSERVAALAAAAARVGGRPATEVAALRRAGLVHDVGRVGVSSRIWERAGPLSDAEHEAMRLHPYYTARALARVPALSGLAELACAHHERCDGSGYHRGLTGAAISPAAALLAAADAYVTSGEPRPHRPARTGPECAELLRQAGEAGRLSMSAAEVVLTAAGAGPGRPLRRTGLLTSREHEVLDLVADGLTNPAIGHRLGVSAKTVNAHLEHVYAKLGVSTRASAVVAAIQRGELAP
jgi:HD-GYP domain-containing protein (c-di-GMP phosphodiesterase class II)